MPNSPGDHAQEIIKERNALRAQVAELKKQLDAVVQANQSIASACTERTTRIAELEAALPKLLKLNDYAGTRVRRMERAILESLIKK